MLRTSDLSSALLVIPALPDAHPLREEIRGCVEKLRAVKGVRELDTVR